MTVVILDWCQVQTVWVKHCNGFISEDVLCCMLDCTIQGQGLFYRLWTHS